MSAGAARTSRIARRSWICPSCQTRLSKRARFLSTASEQSQKGVLHEVPVQKADRIPKFHRASKKPSDKLPDSPARTRFAPSPTGELHIGGLRTALFSYLLAKRTGGDFVLRIEDTDQKRLVPGAEDRLLEDLQWAGLQWDEGPKISGPYGPYRQSSRTEIYQEHARNLLDESSAYRCFCSPQPSGSATASMYVTSGCYQNCSSLSREQSVEKAEHNKTPFTVRLHQPEDAHRRVYPDLIYGNIPRLKRSPAASQLVSEDDTGIGAADTILVKSDGTPTYHFANVVDDHLMKITHVIRGSEWMASTPLHYDIYSAFGWQPPQFAHVGLLVDQNKAKLSKRNQDLAADVRSMRASGILPEVLNNFLALLGWSHSKASDVMAMKDLVRNFNLKFTKGNTVVNTGKLLFLQKERVRQLCILAEETRSTEPIRHIIKQIADEIRRQYPNSFVPTHIDYGWRDSTDPLEAYCTEILLEDHLKYESPYQWVQRNRYFFTFEPGQVPALKQYYNDAMTLTPQILVDAMNFPKVDCGTDEEQNQAKLHSVKDYAAQIQDDFVDSAWANSFQTLESRLKPAVSENSPRRLRGLRPSRFPHEVDGYPETPTKQDVARQLCLSGGVEETEVDALARSFLDVRKATHVFLRERLCYALPGQGIHTTMALLGRDECLRRLTMVQTDLRHTAEGPA